MDGFSEDGYDSTTWTLRTHRHSIAATFWEISLDILFTSLIIIWSFPIIAATVSYSLLYIL